MKVLIGLLLVFSPASWGYIPDYKMILSRLTENHGRGVYSIEQDIVFPHDPDPYIVRETWWIKDENAMRLQVSGQGALKGLIQLDVFYDGSRRHFVDVSGRVRTTALPSDWFEELFYFRNPKSLRSRLVSAKIVPPESLRDRPAWSVKDTQYAPQPFIRLSRTGGTIAYAIGRLDRGDQLNPGIWIEQDQFMIRKLRLPSKTEISADQYQRFTNNLWIPRLREVRWGDVSVEIQLGEVKAIGKPSPQITSLLSVKGLSTTGKAQVIPDQDSIKNFYSQFR